MYAAIRQGKAKAGTAEEAGRRLLRGPWATGLLLTNCCPIHGIATQSDVILSPRASISGDGGAAVTAAITLIGYACFFSLHFFDATIRLHFIYCVGFFGNSRMT